MKIKTLIAYFIFTCAISSCIQDEALNSEAAIDVCSGDDVQLANIDADSKVINVYVNKGADLSKQKLEFTLPQGATIKVNTPITGDTESTYDFSEEPHSRKFTVTSEDGQWLRSLQKSCLHLRGAASGNHLQYGSRRQL